MAAASNQLSAAESFESYLGLYNKREIEPVLARIHPDCVIVVNGDVVGAGKAAMQQIYLEVFADPNFSAVSVQDCLIESNDRDVVTTVVLKDCTIKMNYAFDSAGLMTKHSMLEVTKLE
eukprot:13247-Heterococcus_DN1.PRE.1